MVPKNPLLRLDLRPVKYVVVDAQECPSDKVLLLEEFLVRLE